MLCILRNKLLANDKQFFKLWELNVGNEHSYNVAPTEKWNLAVVNCGNEIPNDYSVILSELSNGQKIDNRIYPYLQKMFDAARADEIYPVVRKAFQGVGGFTRNK